nr:hypothetical protein [Psychrobacter sp. PraFG1]
MTAMTYDPRQAADDNIRIMPTSDDLKSRTLTKSLSKSTGRGA